MKRPCVALIMAMGILVMPLSKVSAQQISSVDGNSYKVFMLCLDDAGDYCDAYQIRDDDFIFDDGDFEIESFKDELFGIGGEGEYEDSGTLFEAEYEVIPDELDNKYEIQVNGASILEEIIIGMMDVIYYEWDITKFGYEEEATARCYFIGIMN